MKCTCENPIIVAPQPPVILCAICGGQVVAHPAIGAYVRILAEGEMQGQCGTIYNYLPSRPHPWHVRPDSWADDVPGIAYNANELECIEEIKPMENPAPGCGTTIDRQYL